MRQGSLVKYELTVLLQNKLARATTTFTSQLEIATTSSK